MGHVGKKVVRPRSTASHAPPATRACKCCATKPVHKLPTMSTIAWRRRRQRARMFCVHACMHCSRSNPHSSPPAHPHGTRTDRPFEVLARKLEDVHRLLNERGGNEVVQQLPYLGVIVQVFLVSLRETLLSCLRAHAASHASARVAAAVRRRTAHHRGSGIHDRGCAPHAPPPRPSCGVSGVGRQQRHWCYSAHTAATERQRSPAARRGGGRREAIAALLAVLGLSAVAWAGERGATTRGRPRAERPTPRCPDCGEARQLKTHRSYIVVRTHDLRVNRALRWRQ